MENKALKGLEERWGARRKGTEWEERLEWIRRRSGFVEEREWRKENEGKGN